jgi:DNA-binding HxlR family transcriptional regulator
MVTRRPGQPRSGCAINAAVEVIGDRWSLLVLRDVMFGNRRHFRVLQERSEEAIASNILANRLRRLVADGLLTRAQAGRGQRAEYSLTEAAIQLVPVMAALGHWGARHRPTTPPLRVRAELWLTAGPIFGTTSWPSSVLNTSGHPCHRAAGRPPPNAWQPPTPQLSPSNRREPGKRRHSSPT